ncbi:uncharacterized protein [Diadema setosum]|uniref:uncharacterized protein n=1 Tax=Diadema setosum TaxID=31175 RepID=UPI003B3ABB58
MFGPTSENPIPYFYDQKKVIQRQKRRRKQPQELPRSLRFANLNPRLAAFLSSQERQKKKQEAELGQGNFNINPEHSSLLIKSSEEAGNSFFALSNNELYRQIFRSSFDNLTLDGEQTQRELYHESVQAAPTLLVKLTSILYLFHDQHLDLPRELMNCLNSSYEDLIGEVQYENFEWQCMENSPEDGANADKEGAADMMDDDKDGLDGGGGDDTDGKKRRRKKKSSSDELTTPCPDGGNTSRNRHGKELPPGTAKSAPGGRCSVKSGRDTGGRLSSTSRTPAGSRRAQTADLPGEVQEAGGVAQPSFLQVISFSITKAKEETGWLIQHEDEDDAMRRNILETIVARLNQSSQEAKVAAFEAKEKGHTHPLSQRYYGDTKREAMAKYMNSNKKPTTVAVAPRLSGSSYKLPPPPKLPQPIPEDHRPKFMATLPDGSVTVHYVSGRLAVITSPAGDDRQGHYTLVYEDSEESPLLAVFTPTGRGCCYDSKGTVRLWCTEKGGMMADEKGVLTTKWEWPLPHLKLNNPVVFKINDQMSLRCANRAAVTLTFTSHKESSKIHVGQTIMASEPQSQEEMGYLLFPEDMYTSNAAKESYPPPPAPPKRRKPKDSNMIKRSQKAKQPTVNPLDEIIKGLEMPNVGEHGIQAEKELEMLRTKARYLLDEWMDHYRMCLNVSHPQLARVSSAAPPTKHRTRLIKSAKPLLESSPTRPRSATNDNLEFLPRPSMPARVPSAPAMALLHRSRPGSSFSDRTKREDGMGRQSKVRIEVDGVDQGYATSRAGSSLSRNTRLTSPHRLMSGKTSVPESEGSGDRQRKAAPLIGCPVALRAELLGDTMAVCKCSRHRIPAITDMELDKFLTEQVPKDQLVVLCVVSSMFPGAMPCGEMLVRLYEHMNRNRTKPCYQCRSDRYRLLIYDTLGAIQGTTNKQPELYRRHNAVPGMFMIYGGGKLLFCDHIFNGYGNAKKDFQKQLSRTLNDHNLGKYLPRDFRFSASRGKHGPRSAWGGEIGGPYPSGKKSVVALPGLDDHSRLIQSSTSSIASSRPQSFHRVVLPPRPHTSGRYMESRADSVLSRLPPRSHLVA